MEDTAQIEAAMLAALEQAWNGGGKPEQFYVFVDGEWRHYDLSECKSTPDPSKDP